MHALLQSRFMSLSHMKDFNISHRRLELPWHCWYFSSRPGFKPAGFSKRRPMALYQDLRSFRGTSFWLRVWIFSLASSLSFPTSDVCSDTNSYVRHAHQNMHRSYSLAWWIKIYIIYEKIQNSKYAKTCKHVYSGFHPIDVKILACVFHLEKYKPIGEPSDRCSWGLVARWQWLQQLQMVQWFLASTGVPDPSWRQGFVAPIDVKKLVANNCGQLWTATLN